MAIDNNLFGDLGNLGSLDDQFKKTGLDKLSETPQKPTDAAQLLAGKVAPIGHPEDKMNDVSLIGEENGVSYFSDQPKGYVAPPKEETFVDVIRDLSKNFPDVFEKPDEQQVKTRDLQQVMQAHMMAQPANDKISPEIVEKDTMTKQQVWSALQEKGYSNLSEQYLYLVEHLEQVNAGPGADKLARLNEIVLKQPHDISNEQFAANLNMAGVQVSEQLTTQHDVNSASQVSEQ